MKKIKDEVKKVIFKALNDAELLKFATEFSDNFRIFHCGDYVSDKNNYHITYSDELINSQSQTWARSARLNTKIIELCRKDFIEDENITKNFVFFMILWCYAIKHVEINKVTDRYTCEFYITTKRDCGDIIYGLEKLFALTNTKENKERLKENKERFDIMRDILIRYIDVSEADKIKQDLLDLAMKKYGINSSFSLTKKAIFLAMDNFAEMIYQERMAEKEHENSFIKKIGCLHSHWHNLSDVAKIINTFLPEEKQLDLISEDLINEIEKVFIIEKRIKDADMRATSVYENSIIIELLQMLEINVKINIVNLVEKVFTKFEIKKR